VLHGDIAAPEVVPDDKPMLRQAAEIAATLDWASEPWRQLTEKVKASSGRKGRALFHPLRLALTGYDSGPEMAALLPIIGRERTIARLESAAR
ncbi:MAG: glutamate--tRNA ligase, partial [Pseudomonadota bacterium]|nr:glutamate--tRNA ligase [Pseudomonadota bacterium]